MVSNNVRIFKFLNATVKGDVEYSHENFVVRSTIGHWYPVNNSGGVFHLHYGLHSFPTDALPIYCKVI